MTTRPTTTVEPTFYYIPKRQRYPFDIGDYGDEIDRYPSPWRDRSDWPMPPRRPSAPPINTHATVTYTPPKELLEVITELSEQVKNLTDAVNLLTKLSVTPDVTPTETAPTKETPTAASVITSRIPASKLEVKPKKMKVDRKIFPEPESPVKPTATPKSNYPQDLFGIVVGGDGKTYTAYNVTRQQLSQLLDKHKSSDKSAFYDPNRV